MCLSVTKEIRKKMVKTTSIIHKGGSAILCIRSEAVLLELNIILIHDTSKTNGRIRNNNKLLFHTM
jgi:hypothetical protein